MVIRERAPSSIVERSFEYRVASRTARVAVVGLGSVGLPLATLFARAGFPVVGIERDDKRRASIVSGRSPLHHLDDSIALELAVSDHFRAGGDARAAERCDAVILCVPTPLTREREPDLSLVRAACAEVAPHLRPGALLVLESTTHPGTTREVLGEVLAAHGLVPGVDVLLAYSPERQDPAGHDPLDSNVPKLVGGTCEVSSRAARALYASAFRHVHAVSSAEIAEAAKLVENAFRAVNIALVNELKIALDAMGLDVWEVIEAAATKPFGFMRFTPGPGTGGSCIPIDPVYLAWAARRAGARTRLVDLAGEIDRAMPRWVLERAAGALASRGRVLEGARVLLLGLAYKPEVDIVTESPALALWELLAAAGASVEYSDPHVPEGPGPERTGGLDLREHRSLALDERVLAGFDVVVLVTDHAAFDYELLARGAPLLVDTRAALATRMSGDERYVRA